MIYCLRDAIGTSTYVVLSTVVTHGQCHFFFFDFSTFDVQHSTATILV